MDKTVEPLTDDAELAKVLEGMQDAGAAAAAAPAGLSFEESQVPPAPAPAVDPNAPTDVAPTDTVPADALPPVDNGTPVDVTVTPTIPTPMDPAPVDPVIDVPSLTPAMPFASDPALESIKKDALEQLRPLVDKLDLEPQEKFDTLLLIIRSTDDKTLVQQTYDVAKLIQDEEIDYFSNPSQG